MVVETIEEQHAAPLLRRVRSDALPEEIDYRDGGCDIHPRCLSCPLPRCRYDEPGGVRAMLNAYRDRQIVALRRQGAPVDLIAERYSLSRRTVFRVLSTSSREALSFASGEAKAGPSASPKAGLEKAASAGGNGHSSDTPEAHPRPAERSE
jgi:hypothetical protein